MVFYGWWMILAMVLIAMVDGGVWYYGLGAFITPLCREFGWTRTEISLGIGLSKLEGAIDGPITGWLSDHIGPKLTSIICIAIASVMFISLSLVNSLWSFYALMFLVWMLPTSTYTAHGTAVARWFDRKAGTAMGLYSVGWGLTGLISPMLVWLIVNYSWRTAFVVAGITLLIVCIPLSFVIKTHGPEHYGLSPDGKALEKKQDTKAPDSAQKETLKGEEKDFTLREALKDRSFWLINIAYSLSNFATQSIMIHLLAHLIDIGFQPVLAALGMTVLTLSSVAGRLGFGWLGDIFKKRYVFAMSFAIMLVGCFTFTSVSTPWAIFLALAIFGPGMGGMMSSKIAIQREYYGRKHWGIIQGVTQAIYSVPTYLGPVYTGWIFDVYGSYAPAFMSFLPLWIVAIVLILMARPPDQHVNNRDE